MGLNKHLIITLLASVTDAQGEESWSRKYLCTARYPFIKTTRPRGTSIKEKVCAVWKRMGPWVSCEKTHYILPWVLWWANKYVSNSWGILLRGKEPCILLNSFKFWREELGGRIPLEMPRAPRSSRVGKAGLLSLRDSAGSKEPPFLESRGRLSRERGYCFLPL